MRRSHLAGLIAATNIIAVGAFGAALAQGEAADQVDPNAPVTIEGTVTTAEYGNDEGWIHMDAMAGGQAWLVRMPGTLALLKDDISAEKLYRGAHIKVQGHKMKDTSCKPACKAAGDVLTLDGKEYKISG